MNVLAMLVLAFAPLADAALEFCGYTIVSNEARFSLEDTDSKTSSAWLPLGKSFQDYTITSFDSAKEVLLLTNAAGATLRLTMRSSPIKDARIRVSGTIKVGSGETAEVTKATLVMGEETTFVLKNGLTLRLKLSPFENNTIRYDAVFEKLQSDGTQKIMSAPAVIALPGKQFEVQVGDLGFSFGP
ncbi:MAG: hypothetical protein ABIZ81_00325 [Opitutaceae bacterium]